MSKNIDEIVAEILPDSYVIGGAKGISRQLLKQALTEKKLVVPMSEEAILDILTRRKEIHRTMISIGMKNTTTEEMEEIVRKELAETIYQAQFKEIL